MRNVTDQRRAFTGRDAVLPGGPGLTRKHVGGARVERHFEHQALRAVNGVVQRIDLANRRVETQHPNAHEPTTLDYDRLVIALGAATNYRDVPGVSEHACQGYRCTTPMPCSWNRRSRS